MALWVTSLLATNLSSQFCETPQETDQTSIFSHLPNKFSAFTQRPYSKQLVSERKAFKGHFNFWIIFDISKSYKNDTAFHFEPLPVSPNSITTLIYCHQQNDRLDSYLCQFSASIHDTALHWVGHLFFFLHKQLFSVHIACVNSIMWFWIKELWYLSWELNSIPPLSAYTLSHLILPHK